MNSLAAVELVRESPPLATWAEASMDPLIVAMLFRATDTLESIVHLRQLGNDADAVGLGRILFEHIVMYAWLLGDQAPPERFVRWWKEDNSHDRKWLSEVVDLRPDAKLARTWLEENPVFKAFQDMPSSNKVKRMPDIKSLVREVDDRWYSPVRAAIGREWSQLSPLYTTLYREGSAYVHAYGSFAYSHINRQPSGAYGPQSPGRILDVRLFYRILTTFAYGLLVTNVRWGWPAVEAIDLVHPRYDEASLKGSRFL
jgi:hypothetical protein